MFFKKKERLAFERLSPTDRLEDLFLNHILPQFAGHDVSYVKSLRCLRFKKELFHFEVYWEQRRYNTRQSDAKFGMRCSLFSAPYRKWEKKYYKPTDSLANTPIDGRQFHRIDSFDEEEYTVSSYALNFKTRKKLAAIISKNINSHLTEYFSYFEAWDDKAILKLRNTLHTFPQTVPLVITDFLILQDRLQDAWTYLDTHDQWYKTFIDQEKSGGEGLNHVWGPPYYARKEKLASLLGLEYMSGVVRPNPDLEPRDDDSIPDYPRSQTREQARQIKARDKAFNDALKACIKGTGWQMAQGEIFRQDGDWFVSNLPTLGYERGVKMRWT